MGRAGAHCEADAVVLGLGPAGASAASHLARAGLHVLALDRARFPRDKCCGDCLSPKALAPLERLGQDDLLREAGHPVRSFRWWGPNGKPSGAGRFQGSPCICLPRRQLDQQLRLEAQRSGAQIEEGVSAQQLLRVGGRVTGVRARRPGGAELIIKAPVTVMATGSLQRLHGGLHPLPRLSNGHGLGLRAYYEGIAELSSSAELHCHPRIGAGYLWIFPLGGGRANVGLGFGCLGWQRLSQKLPAAFRRCLRELPGLRGRFEKARRISPLVGSPVALSDGSLPRLPAGLLPAGDALALCDPLGGEGIANALLSGELAARAVLDAAGAPERSVRLYRAVLKRQLLPELRASAAMQSLSRHPAAFDLLWSRAQSNPQLDQLMISLMADGASALVSWKNAAGMLGPGLDPQRLLGRRGLRLADGLLNALFRSAPSLALARLLGAAAMQDPRLAPGHAGAHSGDDGGTP